MSETNKDSLANIAESKSSIVNIIYCQVYEIMARSAELLGYGADVVAKWETMKAELVENVTSTSGTKSAASMSPGSIPTTWARPRPISTM